MKKFLDDIGPLFAGFQIAASVVGFFGIGVVAKWIIENWLPFTHWVWGELLTFLHLPSISIAEKDALTTLAFFAPMAISSFITYTAPKETEGTSNADAGKEIRLRVYATLMGIAFMILIGGRVIQDTVTLFTTDMPETLPIDSNETPLLDIGFFANIGLIFSTILSILVVSLSLYVGSRRSEVLAKKTDGFFSYIGKKAKPIKKSISLDSIATTLAGISAVTSFGTLFAGLIYAANQLGAIRTAAPLVILLSLLATIFLNPGRLLRTAGVVVALVLASYGWDFAIWVVQAVENTVETAALHPST